MSCLLKCGCKSSSHEIESADENQAHDESLYHHLSEASYFSEAIPLLPKGSDMIKYEADPDNFELLSVIGNGFYGATVVSLAKHIPSGHRVAIKRSNLESGTEISSVQREILVTRQLRHENLLPYLCTFVRNNEIWAVMPLMTFGSARDVLNSHFPSGMPECAVSLILKDVLAALEYVHKRGIIHRSVRASHILISSKGQVVLSGFRYCCNVVDNGRWQPVIHAFPQDAIRNLNWLSPEILEQNLMGYNARSDIYSVGITAFELANAIPPYLGMLPTQVLLAKLQGYIPKLIDPRMCDGTVYKKKSSQDMCRHSPESTLRSHQFGDDFHSFASLCLQRDPLLRPSAHQLKSHYFIKLAKKSGITLAEILATVTPTTDVTKVEPEHWKTRELESESEENGLSPNVVNQLNHLNLDESPWSF